MNADVNIYFDNYQINFFHPERNDRLMTAAKIICQKTGGYVKIMVESQ